jgi:hypothetical protein
MFRCWFLLLGGLVLPAAVAVEPGMKAQVVGGTMASIPAKTHVRLDLTAGDALVLQARDTEFRVDFHKVTTIEYGQNVSRRYAAAILISPVLLLSKSRKHFVTLGFLDNEGKQQAVVFRIEKGDIRSLLAGLEARTGRRVEYQDDNARKSGK